MHPAQLRKKVKAIELYLDITESTNEIKKAYRKWIERLGPRKWFKGGESAKEISR